MKKIIILFCLISFGLLFNTCDKENQFDCFKTTGKETSVTRNLDTFDKILVFDKLEVILIEGPLHSVRLEGGENVLSLVKTEVKGGQLEISNHNTCNVVRSYKRKIKVYVTAPKYSEITHRGVGEINSFDTLHADHLIYRVLNSGNLRLTVDNAQMSGVLNGMGDFNCSGKSDHHTVNANGECHVNCGNLTTKNSDYLLKISGPSYVNVSSELKVIIRNTGNVYYTGNPSQITKDITGTGKLISGF